jgi:hypothetical protein
LAAPRLAPVPRPRAVDLSGEVLAVAAVGVLTAALAEAGRLGWTAPLVLAGCALVGRRMGRVRRGGAPWHGPDAAAEAVRAGCGSG